jgi:hypothetical protein
MMMMMILFVVILVVRDEFDRAFFVKQMYSHHESNWWWWWNWQSSIGWYMVLLLDIASRRKSDWYKQIAARCALTRTIITTGVVECTCHDHCHPTVYIYIYIFRREFGMRKKMG